MKDQIMKPGHHIWEDYLRRLSYVLNAHIESPSDTNCKGDFTFTERILNSIDNIDVDASIEYIKSISGFCDCTVLAISDWNN